MPSLPALVLKGRKGRGKKRRKDTRARALLKDKKMKEQPEPFAPAIINCRSTQLTHTFLLFVHWFTPRPSDRSYLHGRLGARIKENPPNGAIKKMELTRCVELPSSRINSINLN